MDYTPPASTTLKIGAPDESLAQDECLSELEKTPKDTNLTPTNNDCISHFQDTHSVKSDRRYVVCLPRITTLPELGTFRTLVVQKFISNERSLQRKGKLDEFQSALQEYLTVGHAKIIPTNSLTIITTCLFMASLRVPPRRRKSDQSLTCLHDRHLGASLNDTIESGPNLYPLLTDILLRFRKYNIAFSADISKMFREIELHPKERQLTII